MIRETNQRYAIRKALANAGRPLSVDEIFSLARTEVSGLGIATVYRNVKALQSEKQIVRVDVPGEPPRWELLQKDHHHHFLCESCDKLFKVNGCLVNFAALLPKGYTLSEHEILLRGYCDSCSKRLRSQKVGNKKA